MKNIYIKDIKAGSNISDEFFAVKSLKKGLTKDGKPYLDLELSDKTGSIKGKIWSENLEVCDEPKIGDIVRVYGNVANYQNQPQITISALNLAENFDSGDFIAISEHDLTEMKEKFLKYLKSIKNNHLKGLLDNIFDEQTIENYCTWPAAFTVHHAYKGGMVEHTLDLLEMAEIMTKRYKNLNKDLLYTGIILHDIGKLQEYTMTATINISTPGKLLGHIFLGAQLVKEKAPDNIPEELLNEVIHMVLSHQGLLEYGSPVLPKTPEAIVLSSLDDVSAKLNSAYHIIQNSEGDEEFTEYQRRIGTDLYRSKYHAQDSEES